MSKVVRTTLTTDEQLLAVRERPGYVHPCRYGSVSPEPNEVGAIVANVRSGRVEHGMLVQEAEFIERFFMEPP